MASHGLVDNKTNNLALKSSGFSPSSLFATTPSPGSRLGGQLHWSQRCHVVSHLLAFAFAPYSTWNNLPILNLHPWFGSQLKYSFIWNPSSGPRQRESALLVFLNYLCFLHYNMIEHYGDYVFNCLSPRKQEVLFTNISLVSNKYLKKLLLIG